MTELENQHPLIADMMKMLTDKGFAEEEAKAILKAITCKNPEDMPKTCEVVIKWACDTHSMNALLGIVLQTSGCADDGRSLIALSCEDGEIAFAFDPSIDPTKIKIAGGKNGVGENQ